MGRVKNNNTRETFLNVIELLEALQVEFIVEQSVAKILELSGDFIKEASCIAQHADLLVVVGGDGSMLRAAQVAVDHDVPLVGINRGRFGFLADISPDQVHDLLPQVMQGKYIPESRMLLQADLRQQQVKQHALNDIVLSSGDTAHMIEFEVYVDGQFMCGEHSDGMIVATPTGSTAYALSGGGPIIHPASKAIVLVPMFSHTLTSRPIVINAEAEICFKIGNKPLASPPFVSCDGEKIAALQAGEEIHIHHKEKEITLLHPEHYSYFDTLGRKLNWGKKLAKDE